MNFDIMRYLLVLLLVLSVSVGNAGESARSLNDSVKVSEQEQLKELRKQERRTMRGFATFVEAGYLFNLLTYDTHQYGDVIEKTRREENGSKFSALGTVGYRFNNFFFLGAGTGVEYYRSEQFVSVPIFADARVNFLNKRISPYFGLKYGYGLGSIDGVYMDLSLGLSLGIKNGRKRLNCSFVFSGLNDNERWLDFYVGLGFRVGYEF